MKRRGRPPKAIPPPQLARQEEQTGSSSAPHEHIPPPGQQAQPLPPLNTPAQPRVSPQAHQQAQPEQSAASVNIQQQLPQVQQIPPPVQLPQPSAANVPNLPAQPGVAAAPDLPAQSGVVVAPNLPAQAAVPAPAAPVAGVDPAMMAQMMQLQTTLLQVMLAKEQTHEAPPAPRQEPKVGSIRDFNSFNPPVFTGYEKPEDADAWLRRIHNLLIASHIPEAEMVEAARTKMDKTAGAWIESELIKRGNVMTWAEFKELFMQKFIPPHSQRMMLRKFVTLTQGDDDVSTYTHQFEVLRTYASDILPTEQSRIEWYINGLNEQLRPLVRACKPTTLIEAQQSASQMEQDAGQVADAKKVAQKRPASHFSKGGPSVSVKSARTPFQARPASSMASVTQKPKVAITCNGCGKRGHKAAECWKLQGRCLNCGSSEHRARECPTSRARTVQSAPVSFSVPAANKGKAPFAPAAHSVPSGGRGSGVTPARASAPTQGRAPPSTQNAGLGRGKRGVYAMATESKPAGEIITDPVASGDEDMEDPDYIPEEDVLPEADA